MEPGGWLAPGAVSLAKVAIALATAALLLAGWMLRRAGRADALRRTRDAVLLTLGIAGGLGWWSFASLPAWIHPHDAYHYFLGARYFAELGYTRLYACTVVADAEAGFGGDLEARRVRNLETNLIERGSRTAADPERCKSHFSSDRWQEFTRDVAWFRERLPASEWRRLQMDHGFNGSPVWLLAAAPLASLPGGVARWLPALTLVDPLLLALLWTGVARAFGWRAACVAAVFWGTNGFADAVWTSGSLLRQDWLVALVLAIACLRRERAAAAGALATLSTLLRVFPGIAVAALVAKTGLETLRRRSLGLSTAHARFAAGCLVTLAVAAPVASLASGSEAWVGFVSNSRKHLATPLLNQMGLATMVSYDASSRASVLQDLRAADPYLAWKQARRRTLEDRWWVYATAAAAYLGLLVRAIRHEDDWVVLALGTGAIPMATQLTGYYHAALIGLALLFVRREAAGVALCLFAAATQAILLALPLSDDAFTWMSVAETATVFYVTALFGGRAHEPPADAAASERG